MALSSSERAADQPPSDYKVVLIGASTLLGREVKAVIAEHALPLRRLSLVDTVAEAADSDDPRSQFTDFAGEPAVILPIAADAFDGYQVAIFASTAAVTAEHWRRAEQSGCRIIDLSCALIEAGGQLAAPLLAPLAAAEASPSNGSGHALGGVAVSAHPMAIALAGILRIIAQEATVVRSVATILEPASEKGNAGVDELHRQTIGLLSFQEIPKNVFDAQVSFNLLARIGSDASRPLDESRTRIADHLSRLLGRSRSLPAMHLLQAPVFHGYAFNCWVELDRAVDLHALDLRAIEDALDRRPFAVRRHDEEQPSPVSAATGNEILIGAIQPDAANPNGFWLWGAFDNLRVAALNAELILLAMMGLPAERAAAPSPSSREELSADS
jgi:aspartate-semialdehyde dehydrogenase